MIHAFVEIPRNSHYKYELNKETQLLMLDRPLNQAIPESYGFIAGTEAEDGDELDCFVISRHPLVPGTLLEIDIKRVLICTDANIPDHKLICTISNEDFEDWHTNVPAIESYLKTYKKGFVVERIGSKEEALEILSKSQFKNE